MFMKIVTLSIIVFANFIGYAMQQKGTLPFSFKEISDIPFSPLAKPSFIKASDGINLAYYSFLTEKPVAIVLFYHGGGLYGNRTYQHIGMQLQKEHNIASYFVDIRGHGNSDGPRGDAPSKQQVMDDITTLIAFINQSWPSTPLYLVGHSSGAGLLLNYSVSPGAVEHLYKGYILLAPYLGPRVGIERLGTPRFVKKVRTWIFVLNSLFKVSLFQHLPAVFFDYPKELLVSDPLVVDKYTYTMACATTPDDPRYIFEVIGKSCVLYIGHDDEQFNPTNVIAFANYNKKNMIKTNIVPGLKHLSILLSAPKLIAKSINDDSV